MNKLEKLETPPISPEEKLKNQLGENSEDFKDLQRLVEESSGKISWVILEKFTKIENGKVEGIYWEGNLDLMGTIVSSLGKLKKVDGGLNLNGVSCLTDLGELEEVGGSLDLRGNLLFLQLEVIKRIKNGKIIIKKISIFGGIINGIKNLLEVKEIPGSLSLAFSSITSIGKLEKIGGSLDLSFTNIEIQLQVIEKVKNGELIVKGEIYFGGKLSGIEQLLEKEEIPGNLDLKTSIGNIGKLKKVLGSLSLYSQGSLINLGELEKVGGDLFLKGTSISLQLQVMGKINSGKLKVKGKIYYDDFLNYFIENPYFQQLYNFSNKLGEDPNFDGNFINKFEKTFGKPGKRAEQVNEVMVELLQIFIKIYIESLIIKKEEIKQSKSGLTQDLIKYIQEDKVKKDMFLRVIFGDKMLNQAYEEVSKNLNK